MGSKLFLKVSQREERVDRIKAFLALPVAALHFAIMPGRVRANELVMDTKIKGGFLKRVRISRLLLEKRLGLV